MVRLLVGCPVVWLFCPGVMRGAEVEKPKAVQGSLKSVDVDKGTLTFTVGKKDRVYPTDKSTEFVIRDRVAQTYKGKKGLKLLTFYLGEVKKGFRIEIGATVEKKGAKAVVTKVMVTTDRKG